MNKQEWEHLYKILKNIYSDFLPAYQISKNGKDKKIRGDAERKAYNAIRLADSHIRNNSEAFELLTGGEEIPDSIKWSIIYEEFKEPRYFESDMPDFLKKIQEKINNLT